ncbi:hypothetical protein BJY21_002644 [Kineosphaera limosa]|nr:hypothetical protein [Kineosphaera limosa]
MSEITSSPAQVSLVFGMLIGVPIAVVAAIRATWSP